MQTTDIIVISIVSVFSLIVVIMAIVLLCGRGSGLIAGFNTLSKEEKAKYDTKKLSKFMGAILLPIGLSLNCISLGIAFNIKWLPILIAGIVLGLIIFAVIYCNTGNRFKK